MEFVMKIRMGNEAMNDMQDVLNILNRLTYELQRTTETEGKIRDENGNTVGSWELRERE